MNRRRFLANSAKAALAVPFLRAAQARAQLEQVRRLVVVFKPDGIHHPSWLPGAGFSFAPGSCLEPMAADAEDMLVIQGCHLTTSGTHEHGTALLLTGGGAQGDVGNGMSIDRYIGQELRAGTRFQQMNFGIASNFLGGAQHNITFSEGGVFQPAEDNPEEMFNALFGGLSEERTVDWRATRLALTRADLAELRDRVGSELTSRLDTHASALDALQQRFTPTGPQQACEPPGLRTYPAPAPGFYPAIYELDENFPNVAANQRDLLVASLACDATRVATISYSHSVSPTVFSWLNDENGNPLTDSHHGLSHHGEGSGDSKLRQYIIAERWLYQEIHTLIDQLRNTQDPLGTGTLLDSTLVVIASEIADSQLHDSFNMPFILVGGGIRGNRLLQLQDVRHNRLLVTIASYMGIDISTYGDTAGGSGVIDEVLS